MPFIVAKSGSHDDSAFLPCIDLGCVINCDFLNGKQRRTTVNTKLNLLGRHPHSLVSKPTHSLIQDNQMFNKSNIALVASIIAAAAAHGTVDVFSANYQDYQGADNWASARNANSAVRQ